MLAGCLYNTYSTPVQCGYFLGGLALLLWPFELYTDIGVLRGDKLFAASAEAPASFVLASLAEQPGRVLWKPWTDQLP